MVNERHASEGMRLLTTRVFYRFNWEKCWLSAHFQAGRFVHFQGTGKFRSEDNLRDIPKLVSCWCGLNNVYIKYQETNIRNPRKLLIKRKAYIITSIPKAIFFFFAKQAFWRKSDRKCLWNKELIKVDRFDSWLKEVCNLEYLMS